MTEDIRAEHVLALKMHYVVTYEHFILFLCLKCLVVPVVYL